ncbi:AraC family transcriptional regulator [Chitinophaga tropicalis]|uniref:Helix-turn-helix domain-containing protein n=1 Tax=Chitinophaga tropicalis TaxID=2683588 RepID=A0A7K1U640_9BACT|nr:helix-turn-helix domain-containing protein [Chitinophaga tropicalis]MVT09425.1 helix-turn-helix domain-containing protein [Chitinophaga tropicalis]
MLPVNDTMNTLFLDVHQLMKNPGDMPVSLSDGRSNHFFIVYLHEGHGKIEHSNGGVEIKARTVYFLYPGQITYLNDLCARGTAIEFSSGIFNRLNAELYILMTPGMFSPMAINQLTITDDSYQEIEHLLMLMQVECLGISTFRREVLEALLKVFLANLTKKIQLITEASGSSADVDLVTRFLGMIHSNFVTMKKVSDYANKLCISPNYLSTKVRIVTGHSARHHIQQRIVHEAKQHAEKGTKTLKEVAYTLGFEDLSHFSKFFKNITGMNFTDFRNRQWPCSTDKDADLSKSLKAFV